MPGHDGLSALLLIESARDALPNAAIVAASCASAGSVRGYDDLFPSNPSVVSERRQLRVAGDDSRQGR